MPPVIPEAVNTSVFRFHVLKDTRDVDLSELPEGIRYVHDLNQLVPVFDRAAFVAEGLLPHQNSQFTDAEVRQYVGHMRMLDAIQTIDPSGIYHHCIMEDKVDMLPGFMRKNLNIINNVPRSYDIAHFYVFPQQSWIFDRGNVYETIGQLRGACAYTLSPAGRAKILTNLHPMTASLEFMLRNSHLESYTIYTDMVEHTNINDIGENYDDFHAKL